MTSMFQSSIIASVMMLILAVNTLAQQSPRKPRIDDSIKANVYADNSFKLYINGELVAIDSIAFVPHNVVPQDGGGGRQGNARRNAPR